MNQERGSLDEAMDPVEIIGRGSPLRVLLTTALAIFAAEVLIMLIVAVFPPLRTWQVALLDAALLVFVLSPLLYGLVFRPLTRLIKERENAMLALREEQDGLEERVRTRTAELAKASETLTKALEDVEQRYRDLALLGEMVNLLQACDAAEEAYDVFTRFTKQLFRTESGSVYVFKSSRNVLEIVAAWGQSIEPAPTFPPGDCWALRTGQPHLALRATAVPLACHHLEGSGIDSCLCIPMMAQGETLGVLMLHVASGSTGPTSVGEDERQRLSESSQRLATATAASLSLAVANLNLREELRDQAIRDPLTGLYNRRYFEEMQEREIRRARRREAGLAVLMLDIDHFKRFNDSYGHDAGDALLRAVGRVLRDNSRGDDIACRFGGEEFTLLLPESSLDGARICAEKLREGLKRLKVRHGGLEISGPTASFGVAGFPDHGGTVEELLKAADRALYRAKKTGRDRVALAE